MQQISLLPKWLCMGHISDLSVVPMVVLNYLDLRTDMQVPLSSDIMSDISLTSLGVVVAHVSPWVSSSRQFDLVCGATWKRLHHSSSRETWRLIQVFRVRDRVECLAKV